MDLDVDDHDYILFVNLGKNNRDVHMCEHSVNIMRLLVSDFSHLSTHIYVCDLSVLEEELPHWLVGTPTLISFEGGIWIGSPSVLHMINYIHNYTKNITTKNTTKNTEKNKKGPIAIINPGKDIQLGLPIINIISFHYSFYSLFPIVVVVFVAVVVPQPAEDIFCREAASEAEYLE
jgi:hypothetical protein